MSITKKGSSKSRKRSQFDEQTPWPQNPDGYVVSKKEIEGYIGNQTVRKAQTTARRFMVVADAGRAIGRGENVDLNWRLIRYTASLDKSESYQRIIKAIMSAIESGEKGIFAAYCTVRYLIEFGFEYTACCNREKLHLDKLKQIMRGVKIRR
jgi:hypothetical protein